MIARRPIQRSGEKISIEKRLFSMKDLRKI
jgi:hypothetical protein